jgi:hypothetical protein
MTISRYGWLDMNSSGLAYWSPAYRGRFTACVNGITTFPSARTGGTGRDTANSVAPPAGWRLPAAL